MCDPLVIVLNARQSVKSYGIPGFEYVTIGATISATCNEHFVMSGDFLIECLSDGSWTSMGTCYPGVVKLC